MPKRATAVILSEKEQEGLLQITRRHRSEQQVVLRARIVLAAAQGSSNARIARELGVNVDTVRLWRDRWVGRQGIDLETWSLGERLQDAPVLGRLRSLQQSSAVRWQCAHVKHRAKRSPHQPVDGQRDRRRNKGAWDRDPDFSSTCGSVAQKGGLQPHRFRYWLTEKADEQREEKIVEGC